MGRFLRAKEHVLANKKEWVTSEYGYRTDPITKRPSSYHPGMDFVDGQSWAPDNIIAFEAGKVTTVVDDISWSYSETHSLVGIDKKLYHGNHVILTHEGGFTTTYKHIKLGSIVVKLGDTVAKGAKLGIVGTTGYSTGNHLHFELALNGTRQDPGPYFMGIKKLPITAVDSSPRPSTVEVRRAIDKIASMGLVNPAAYWYAVYPKLPNLDYLFIAAAKAIVKVDTPCATVQLGIAALTKAKVINTPEYWLQHYKDIAYLEGFLKRLGGCIWSLQ